MRNIFFLVFISACIVGCYYDNEEELYQNLSTPTCDTTNVTYSGFIEPLVSGNCTFSGCHGGQFPAANLDLTTYASVKQIADDGRFVGRTTGEGGPIMPQGGPLPDCDVEKIAAWVNDGALNN